jgi:hypothetical protein
MENSDKLMTVEELIEYLPDKPSIHTVYYWTSKELIPFKKIGKKLFFKQSEINKWNENNRIKEII